MTKRRPLTVAKLQQTSNLPTSRRYSQGRGFTQRFTHLVLACVAVGTS